MPDGKDGFMMMFRAESIFSWTEHINVNRPQDEEDDMENAALAAEDMDSMTVARDSETSVAKLRFDLDLPPAGEDDAPLGAGIALPEWDFKNKFYSLSIAVCKSTSHHMRNLASCRHTCVVRLGACVANFKHWHQLELGLKDSRMGRSLTSMLGCVEKQIC